MSSKKNYTDLIAWQKAMDLAGAVYRLTAGMPADERYGLTSQMRRAVVSIPANIAEGQGRETDGEFLNCVSVSHGSIRELETHVMLARDLGLIDRSDAEPVLDTLAEVGRVVSGLARSLRERIAARRAGSARP